MKIVVMKERSQGNDTVGDQWIETAIFNDATPLREVVAWAARYESLNEPDRLRRGCKYGRLMLSIPDEIEKGEE